MKVKLRGIRLSQLSWLRFFLILPYCQGTLASNIPNFVFILTDDISAEDLGMYGNKHIHTPNLDRIADLGLVFENAFLTTSSCSPSRNSIITGRYPHNTGAPEIHMQLPENQLSFVQLLKQAGFHTVLSGKNHMAPPEQLGFLEFSDSQPAGSENWVTGDNIPDAPTPNKAALHGDLLEWERGETPGEVTKAYKINHSGPVFID